MQILFGRREDGRISKPLVVGRALNFSSAF